MAGRKVCFGLVCVTASEECRYRTITRTRLLSLPAGGRKQTLQELYWANLGRLSWTIGFCQRRGIRLYRVTSDLFPFSDEPIGRELLLGMRANLSAVGRRLERLGMRMVIHPDQFVVLNSESAAVVENSVEILMAQAMWFDLLGLPRSPWSAMNIHGGKSDRAEQLVAKIKALPEAIQSRLTLENDEHAYGAQQILEICRAAGVPMVFDNLHHAVKEKLSSYDDPSFEHYTREARKTWRPANWQLVHLSNGRERFDDPRHSEIIEQVPPAYGRVQWIEVEAKGKERAIERLAAGGRGR